ncbi:hypothetical protein MKW94_015662 [Papaver nudicaule]|uniref:Secreted protein n=1 Tax=Papaver nudicaule TaxID=74823 RepID=A0AA41RZZ1_PAPNU|nr:hypothetical protein [Papaver nudicaule]
MCYKGLVSSMFLADFAINACCLLFGFCCVSMQEVAGERGGYLHGRGGSLSPSPTPTHTDALYVIFLLFIYTGPAPVPLPLRVEPKPKSGIRQQDLLKNIVEIRPKRTLATASHAVATKTLFIVYNKPRFELFCL